MKLPKEIRCGPYRYAVTPDRLDVDGDGRYAETDNVSREIRLGKMCDPERKPITLLHEIIHVVEYTMGLDFKEAEVRRLAVGLCDALQNMGVWPGRFD
jgi:hypothetical protein